MEQDRVLQEIVTRVAQGAPECFVTDTRLSQARRA
jgi:hypothetical protein